MTNVLKIHPLDSLNNFDRKKPGSSFFEPNSQYPHRYGIAETLQTGVKSRGGSRTAATSKMECFVIIVNGSKPLTIITKSSMLDVGAVLDLPLKKILSY